MPPMPPRSAPSVAAPASAEPGSLLKRYLLPVGLYDEPSGDLFLVHAVRQRNLARLRRWMPHYARVHGALALMLLLICSTAEASTASNWLVAVAAVPTALEVMLAIGFACFALVLRWEVR